VVALRFRFPAGRYHATPWGRHVNEGLVEWPPSPWRILRALVAVGFTRHGWTEQTIPDTAFALVEQLSEHLPSYHLPPAVASHSRHYMPIGANTTKIFDAFAHVGSGELWVRWETELRADSRSLLDELATALPYLGRAESWVQCTVHDDWPEGMVPNAYEDLAGDERAESVRLLVPVTPESYRQWREPALHRAVDGLSKAKRRHVEPLYPPCLLSTLLVSTATLQKAGWVRPPGTKDVMYVVPADALAAPRLAGSRPPIRSAKRPELALFAVTGDSEHGTLRPRTTQALALGELLHFSLAKKLDGLVCPELTGRDEAGEPMRGHRHAHLMPLDLDSDHRIDHILVWCPLGLGREARDALYAIRFTHDREHDRRAFLTVAALGSREDLLPLLGPADMAVLSASRCWKSSTPFIAPRFVKATGRNTLEEQVRAELHSRDLPEPRRIEIAARDEAARGRFYDYVRTRRGRSKAPPTTYPWHITLQFDDLVCGPLSLGYGAHLGLGQFVPAALA